MQYFCAFIITHRFRTQQGLLNKAFNQLIENKISATKFVLLFIQMKHSCVKFSRHEIQRRSFFSLQYIFVFFAKYQINLLPVDSLPVNLFKTASKISRISWVPRSYLGSPGSFFRICRTTKYKPAGNTAILYWKIRSPFFI